MPLTILMISWPSLNELSPVPSKSLATCGRFSLTKKAYADTARFGFLGIEAFLKLRLLGFGYLGGGV
jgi:hypothetical protein